MSYSVMASLFLLVAATVLALLIPIAPILATIAIVSGLGSVTFAVLSLRE